MIAMCNTKLLGGVINKSEYISYKKRLSSRQYNCQEIAFLVNQTRLIEDCTADDNQQDKQDQDCTCACECAAQTAVSASVVVNFTHVVIPLSLRCD